MATPPVALRGQRQEFPVHPVSSGDSSHPLWFDGDQLVHDDATEYLAYALRARAPEVPPNCPQQPTIATSSNLGTRA